MSDFFGDITSGIRLPAAQINQGGPLPGGPYTGFDGQINATSQLLGSIQPYGGAKGLPMGSDRNYQHIPHRSQQIIPPLYLPHSDKREKAKVKVSHAVDQGDVAFILLTNRMQNLIMASEAPGPRAHAPGRNAFCNLATVNYLLAGLQRLDSSDKPRMCNWAQLAEDMDFKYDHRRPHAKLDIMEARDEVLRLLETRIMPFGICAGSEKQGGLHETGLAPVQAAVNHVTTMTVDGQNRDLVNYWRGVGLSRGGRGGISAGDQLIFRLEWLPTKNYTLNHYYKGMVSQIFGKAESCWQLVPDKFEMNAERNEDFKKFQKEHPNVYDYRYDGYWRIAQTFQHRNAHDAQVENYSNDMCFMRGQLLQVTFAPVWVRMQPRVHRKEHKMETLDAFSGTGRTLGTVGTKRKAQFSWGFDDSEDEKASEHDDDSDDDDEGGKEMAVETSQPVFAPVSAPVSLPKPVSAPASQPTTGQPTKVQKVDLKEKVDTKVDAKVDTKAETKAEPKTMKEKVGEKVGKGWATIRTTMVGEDNPFIVEAPAEAPAVTGKKVTVRKAAGK